MRGRPVSQSGGDARKRNGAGHGLAPGLNTSARIAAIRDVRLAGGDTFTFSYNNDTIPHLTSIANQITTGERYTLGYAGPYALRSPFTPQVDFGTTTALNWVEVTGTSYRHTFEYGTNGAAELSAATLPYGARLEWTYQDFTNAAGITVREIQYRGLGPSAGAPVKYHAFYFDSGDSGRQYQLERTVMDETWLYDRTWRFETSAGSPGSAGAGSREAGLLGTFVRCPASGGTGD